jgi:hypothetical protein
VLIGKGKLTKRSPCMCPISLLFRRNSIPPILNVPDILNKKSANPWNSMFEKKQDLNKILENISQLFE